MASTPLTFHIRMEFQHVKLQTENVLQGGSSDTPRRSPSGCATTSGETHPPPSRTVTPKQPQVQTRPSSMRHSQSMRTSHPYRPKECGLRTLSWVGATCFDSGACTSERAVLN
ncbi:hypothetical protein J6590_023506 [Homalodisca vitripennis]|nr:hypothetical protein J6590_023506 [Homalodisca vitripennis]